MFTQAFEGYVMWLERLPLSKNTTRGYRIHVKQYLGWLQSCPDGEKALTDAVERDYVVREYKQRLLMNGKSASTVNASLSALDNFGLFLGIGFAKVKRQELPKQAPRALERDEQRRFLRTVAASKSLRNKTIAGVLLNCGLRLSEVAQLNVGDILLSARKRELVVRCGKGSKRRIVPINGDLAEQLQQYLASIDAADQNAPLFKSQRNGTRLSTPAIDRVIRLFGKECGLELSCHVLRHSFVTSLIRNKQDIVVVAELCGHSRLETTRRYSLPTELDKLRAVETLSTDYAAQTA
jgi:integrase/recombinase XerC